MAVTLNAEIERFINEKVESGQYASPDAVLHEALALLQQRDEKERLRQSIAVGLEQLDRGEGKVYDAESLKARFEEIKARGTAQRINNGQ